MGKVTLRWIEGVMMVGSDSNGHSVVIGKSPDSDHVWAGIKPSDLLLLSVASCASHDLVEILIKQREPLEDLKVVHAHSCTLSDQRQGQQREAGKGDPSF